MKSKLQRARQISGLLAGGALAIASAGAYAIPSITNVDGTFDPFGGFDWNKAGSAKTVGPIVDGATVTTTYMANAIAVVDTSSNVFVTPGLKPPASPGTYEYTAFATFTETVSCGGGGGACGNTATFTATGGTWAVYYDTAHNANLVTGTGITDGIKIISGTVDSGGGTFTLSGTGGIGVFSYEGAVTATDNTFVNPNLIGTTAIATLQFGSSTTNWVRPTGFAVAAPPGGATPVLATDLVFQADGNQSFTVPEPGTLALLGTLALGLGFVGRRRSE